MSLDVPLQTDPENTDYVIEAGATRNFQALKLAEEQAEREEQERLEEEKSNPMKVQMRIGLYASLMMSQSFMSCLVE